MAELEFNQGLIPEITLLTTTQCDPGQVSYITFV